MMSERKYEFKQDHELTNNGVSHFTHLIDHINAGTWEFNVSTHEVKWSDCFYRILGYAPGEIECSNNFFYDHLLYHQDRQLFTRSVNGLNANAASTTVQVRLLTKSYGYQWFENTSHKNNEADSQTINGSIINIHPYKLAQLQAARTELLLDETGKIAKVAIWELEVSSMDLSLTKEGYDIFGLSNPVKLSISEVVSFFEPTYRSVVESAIADIIRLSKAFDLELPFRTARNRVKWVRFKAIAVIDNYGRCISLRGIIQDIDASKKREIELQSSLSLLSDQNKRLQNFAYIVSHNLRSHTGNLKFMIDLYNQPESETERGEIFEHIRSISDSLATTVKHLEEVVKVQAEITGEKTIIAFEPLFKNMLGVLANNITEANARIEYDFSHCPEINYIPAYLESILQNLLTNSLKYNDPDRLPVIKCRTYKHGEHIYLVFEDNGLGIDMERYGDEVFGMYKTFHQHDDSKGIGLFITRNQVEALGGSIHLESEVNVGTTFTIRLN